MPSPFHRCVREELGLNSHIGECNGGLSYSVFRLNCEHFPARKRIFHTALGLKVYVI